MSKVIIIVIIATHPACYVRNMTWLFVFVKDMTVLMSKVIIIVIIATHPTCSVSNLSWLYVYIIGGQRCDSVDE